MLVHLILLIDHLVFLLVDEFLDAFEISKVNLLVNFLQVLQSFLHLFDLFAEVIFRGDSFFLTKIEIQSSLLFLSK